jgi:hypothetical protein
VRWPLLKTAGRDGMTQGILSALGFDASMTAGLVNQGFATLTSLKVRTGCKLIEVDRVRIKAAGRHALAES